MAKTPTNSSDSFILRLYGDLPWAERDELETQQYAELVRYKAMYETAYFLGVVDFEV